MSGYFFKGSTLGRPGEYEEALDCFEEAQELDPENLTTEKYKEKAFDALD